jgi:hypothetical protein
MYCLAVGQAAVLDAVYDLRKCCLRQAENAVNIRSIPPSGHTAFQNEGPISLPLIERQSSDSNSRPLALDLCISASAFQVLACLRLSFEVLLSAVRLWYQGICLRT